ncbi:flagellar motor switch protein FliN [Gluconacetobacter diazotrophicus PA1 5]|uniref:Flagellar motor switch protein FliN n=2 Tax=Gluconacetobacter diazotrophicus TaxID=33996 RepID=A9HHD1_GLUDA|nr:flagellar motor switch protein FliN [Gluconacetobacter diazotrophicus]ACI53186.1 flagellar motor switch protein FliN [Gluconacetobacter diazotrophicus PA1 5]MBB2156063.1 flagellar motor switch protein FliN [Gluconacetobacter diazotrophicus]TWB10440.1 flagellar motor switch protein FliN/FliY [Gluconacetobacter diazotrophicus]CAP55622.1 putative flagellar motor switch protein fliN [Gluconacetobacter diazotrophicus PA1 5]
MSTNDPGIGLEDFSSAAPSPAGAEPDGSATAAGRKQKNGDGSGQMEAVYDIPVKITAVIGSATMPVSQLLKLGRGAVVELDRKLGEAVDIYANNRLIARGEVVVVDDNHIGVTMTEIISSAAVSG